MMETNKHKSPSSSFESIARVELYGDEALYIDVKLKERPYPVWVQNKSRFKLGKLVSERIQPSSCMVISDSNVAALYLDEVVDSVKSEGIPCHFAIFEAGEASKTLSTVEKLLLSCMNAGLDRNSCIIALGGGVVGDIAGFVAGLYMRGIRVVQMPTSLLAMVDSSVGGKTGVDLESCKNLVGVFIQPEFVLVDTDCLNTLSEELFVDSLGEVVKHAVLADTQLFELLSKKQLTKSDPELAYIIARNIEIKRDVVVNDVYEQGLRQTLNLGHSIGHAIEASLKLQLGHGSCVALGLCAVVRGAAKLGLCPTELIDPIQAAVKKQGLSTEVTVDIDEVLEFMLHDKKRRNQVLTLVIPECIGKVVLHKAQEDEVRAIVCAGLDTHGLG